MSIFKELVESGDNVRRKADNLKDRRLAQANAEARRISAKVNIAERLGGGLTANLARQHSDARVVETVTRAVGRKRTRGNPEGHVDIPENMRETPKRQASFFGRKSKRRRGAR